MKNRAKQAEADTIKAGLFEMGLEDSRYDALYHRVASAFGLTTCQMWIFYYLTAVADGLTQREIARRMAFPKQTVNSAVAKLESSGLVTLAAVEGSRKEKVITLTATGRKLAKGSSARLLAAEIRATAKLGIAKMNDYNRLRAEYLRLLQAEFEADFLGEADG